VLVNVFPLDLFAMRSDSSALLVCSLVIYWFYYDLHFLFLDVINHFMFSLSRLKKVRENPLCIFKHIFSRGFLLHSQNHGAMEVERDLWRQLVQAFSARLIAK